MRNGYEIHVTALVAGLAGAIGCSASDPELADYEQRIRGMDREALGAELLHIGESTLDPLSNEAARAKLDVIESRVDELDGLIYRLDLDDGTTMKVYQREHGRLHLALFGAPDAVEQRSIDGLGPVDAFRVLAPDQPVPEVLLDAEILQREQIAQLPRIAQPEAVEGGTVTQHHDVRDHGRVSDLTWVWQDCPGGFCFASVTDGDRDFHSHVKARGYIWRILLNQPGSGPLSTLMVSDFSTEGDSTKLFGDFWGPWFSTTGELVKFETAGWLYNRPDDSWYCSFVACAGTPEIRTVRHHVRVRVAPGASYHLSGQADNASWPFDGSFF